MNYPLYIKAVHIIFVVTWFAGLFYIVRLFVYHTEAEKKEENERRILQTQYKIMEKRLWYGITWPSMVLTVLSGLWLVYYFNYWAQPWMLLKFGLVFGLILYHLQCGRIFNQLQKDVIKHTSFKLRLWNEIATVFLAAIVFVIVLKSMFDWLWGLASLLLLAVALTVAVRMYKSKRKKNENN
ncbi:MAG: protoporphyrinogen IX oxidase [Flavobacteriales bacterium]|nr:MAG: protoporphyrinogen IX oxidase [Flavobacteriales bacterium]